MNPGYRISLRCIASAAFAIVGSMAVLCCFSILRDILPEIWPGQFFAQYHWEAVSAGGAFDQGGLTKGVVIIFVLEVLVVLGRDLGALVSRRRLWRVGLNTLFIAALVVPFVMSLHLAWELSRLIAVMGMTLHRVIAVRLVILFFFVPAFCTARWAIGIVGVKRIVMTCVVCQVVACAVFFAVDAAARRAVASHPRPTVCWPNNVAVPSSPETSPDYGLAEVVFWLL